MFRKLTLPLLRPIMAMVIILTIIGAFQVFDIVAVATGGLGGPPGGPANAFRTCFPTTSIRPDSASLTSVTR